MGVVLFAFGAAQVPPGGSLPGLLLLELLDDLGLTRSATRSVLLRMRRDGLLVSTRVGRQAYYRLTPAVIAMQRRLEAQLRGHRQTWDGAFHGLLYEIPETHRAFRDQLRRVAHLAGYGILRPGLLIAPTDRSTELAATLEHTPAQAQVLQARVQLSVEDSQRVAGQIWDLASLTERYRAVISATTNAIRALATDLPNGGAALRAMATTLQPLYDIAGTDPDLPAELLPPDWPGEQIGQAIGAALRVLAPRVGSYIDTLRTELGTGEMGEQAH